MAGTNPLLQWNDLTPFALIKPEHWEPALAEIFKDNRAKIDELLETQKSFPTWEGLVRPMQVLHARWAEVWSPIQFLDMVNSTTEIQEVYKACSALNNAWKVYLNQNSDLYKAYQKLRDEAGDLEPIQQKVLDVILRGFHKWGIHLKPKDHKSVVTIISDLNGLADDFKQNISKADKAWRELIEVEDELKGLSGTQKNDLKAAAKEKGEDGWMITANYADYVTILTHATNRGLRGKVYHAHLTRASTGEHDNGPVMNKILAKRHELARLLGFPSYRDMRVATNSIVKSSKDIQTILSNLVSPLKRAAAAEMKMIRECAEGDQGSYEEWDKKYYAEKLRQKEFSLTSEEPREYFPFNTVLFGLFKVVETIYGIEVAEIKNVSKDCKWHDEIRLFKITQNGNLVGRFFLDPYERSNKEFMNVTMSIRKRGLDENGKPITPIDYFVCNFKRPTGNDEARLYHREVRTLFHELGHILHGALSPIEYPEVSGRAAIPEEGLETQGRFMEGWVWDKTVLRMISKHSKTGKPLPDDLLARMVAARNYMEAQAMLDQMELAWADFEMNSGPDCDAVETFNATNKLISVVRRPNYYRYINTFSHIFGPTGLYYGSKYWSYKLADIIGADIFSKFDGLNPATGHAYLRKVLAPGGSKEALDLLKDFLGRDWNNQAFLRNLEL